jgi:hypothetical protein
MQNGTKKGQDRVAKRRHRQLEMPQGATVEGRASGGALCSRAGEAHLARIPACAFSPSTSTVCTLSDLRAVTSSKATVDGLKDVWEDNVFKPRLAPTFYGVANRSVLLPSFKDVPGLSSSYFRLCQARGLDM